MQESLTNVRKHAKAKHVKIDIAIRGAGLRAVIADDGSGFDASTSRPRAEAPRFGLTTMRERAESIGGKLIVETGPGRGTTVIFELPLAEAT